MNGRRHKKQQKLIRKTAGEPFIRRMRERETETEREREGGRKEGVCKEREKRYKDTKVEKEGKRERKKEEREGEKEGD